MPLSNDQIVNSLIAFYKSQGVDLSYLMEDPVFKDLKTPDKVEAIRTHAKTLYEGSSPGMTRSERAGILSATAMGAASGVGVGISASALGWQAIKASSGPLANSMARNKAIAASIGIGGVLAGLAGAAAGYARAKNQASARLSLRNQLGLVSKDPSDTNIIGVLSTGATYARQYPLRNALYDKAVSKMESVASGALSDAIPNVFASEYTFQNTINPVQPLN